MVRSIFTETKLVLECPIKSLVLSYMVLSIGLNFVVLVLVSNMSIIKTLGIGLELFPISRLVLVLVSKKYPFQDLSWYWS